MTQVVARKASAAPAPRIAAAAIRRAVDIVASLVLIILLTPLLLTLCILLRWTSDGPVLFRQERLGLRMQPFVMLKLRTMYPGSNDRLHREYVTGMLSPDRSPVVSESGLFKLADDPRITPLGAWLRRTSLDELPQLINVLRGEMSLVGPRPMLSWEARLLDAPYPRRFEVKPGMTGLWQVSGRSRLSMREALDLDIEYVARRSLTLDLAILLRTVPEVLKGGAG